MNWDEIGNIIEYESENTRIDFKLREYAKSEYLKFLKDVLSMSNANISDTRYIIIGLKPKSTEDRGIEGIEGNLIDQATFQQLVHDNIEPEVHIDYYPYTFNGKLFGVFRILDCNDQPYLMKKDYGDGKSGLRKGDGFIRIGTHQTRLLRGDYDRIYKSKFSHLYFSGDVIIGFSNTNLSEIIELNSLGKIELPSQIQRNEIEKILKEKKRERDSLEKLGFDKKSPFIFGELINPTLSMFGGVPYENRTIETLEKNLKDVSETYLEDDYYALFEENSHKVNIEIKNLGTNYIEDGSVQIIISQREGLLISDKVYQEPRNDGFPNINIEPLNICYPMVEKEDGKISIRSHPGDIKHHLKQEVFDESLRIVLLDSLKGETLELNFTLFGKNLEKPINRKLSIKVI